MIENETPKTPQNIDRKSEEVQDIIDRMPTHWAAWTALVVAALIPPRLDNKFDFTPCVPVMGRGNLLHSAAVGTHGVKITNHYEELMCSL